LEITSPTSGGRSVGIVRLRTQATELSLSSRRWQRYVSPKHRPVSERRGLARQDAAVFDEYSRLFVQYMYQQILLLLENVTTQQRVDATSLSAITAMTIIPAVMAMHNYIFYERITSNNDMSLQIK
jgi:hypothetical protein